MGAPQASDRAPVSLRPRHVWGAGVVVACIALLGVVVVAADGQPLRAPRSSDHHELSAIWQYVLAGLFGVAVLGGVAIVVYALSLPRARRPPVGRRKRRWPVTLAVVLLAMLAYLLFRPDRNTPPHDQAPAAPAGASAGDDGDQRQRTPSPWSLLLLGGVGAVALIGTLTAARRMTPTAEEGPSRASPALVAAVDASIEDLEQAGDPRSGVIAAYARLLEGLEAAGSGRLAAETPLEYLHRSLRALPIGREPAECLTMLFVEARFSTHVIAEEQREQALAALRAVRRDLTDALAAAP